MGKADLSHLPRRPLGQPVKPMAAEVSPKPIPSPKAVSPKSKSGYERNKRLREAHPDRYRDSQRDLMRRRGAKA